MRDRDSWRLVWRVNCCQEATVLLYGAVVLALVVVGCGCGGGSG